MPSRRAISCVDTDDAFSRIISRAWRIVIRSAGTDRSLGLPKGRPDQANGGAHQSTKDPGRDHSVMGGAIISESGGGIIPLRGAASHFAESLHRDGSCERAEEFLSINKEHYGSLRGTTARAINRCSLVSSPINSRRFFAPEQMRAGP